MDMEIPADLVKRLREMTGAGVMLCKEALRASKGDLDGAVEYLRKKGMKTAESKAGRAAKAGIIGSYIHHNLMLGTIVDVRCETDFVARNEEFRALARDLAMHVANSRPRFLARTEVPPEVIEKEKEIYAEQVKAEGKPAQAAEKIVAGKMENFFKEQCLLDQPFIKDDKVSVADTVKAMIAKMGENITIVRFACFAVGE
jgi:elongation factor Ts